ncbi:pentatricopeptide repeat-containing protein At3g22690 [Impatiens glandulifera]|uniref:pentatricopeptide repeat-containing protein At3g22690 n=1 Tax=Impatiens glandulifera TaxID=253017 RepID=UPI001FB18452|nr:pentatricopeptide repeat-containing protein At3g22690 [Impatiens glandulifera]
MADLTLSPLISKTIIPFHKAEFRSPQSKPSNASQRICRNLNELKQMHAQSMKKGINQKPSFLTKLIALCAEINTPESLEYATNAFELSDNQMNSVYAFNSLIRAYSSSGHNDKGILLYVRLMNENLKPDHYTFPFVLSACAKRKDLAEGLQIHGSLIKMSLEHDMFIQNSLIHLYFECGEIEYGHKVFDKMSERNVVSWTSLICGLARRGLETEAISLFFEMVQTGISPNQVTMVAVVSACSKLMDLNVANRISAYICDSKLETNTILVNALVDMFLKCGDIDQAKRYFDESLDKNLVLYNTMLSNYIHQGLELEAIGILDEMLIKGHRPDRITMLSAVYASSRLGYLSFGRQCHGYVVRNGLDESDSVSNAIIDMYIKCCKLDSASNVFDRMPNKSLVSWNIIIRGLVDEGLFEEAVGFFRGMQMEGLKPDKVTMASVALACGWLGSLDTAKWIYGFVIKNAIECDVKLSTSLVNMFAKCGDPRNAMRVFDRMVEKDTSAWTAAIGAMAMEGNGARALELFDEMTKEGFEPDGVTFVEVLTACSHAGLVNEGRQVFRLIDLPNVFHYGCMVDLLGRAGFLEGALDVIKNMPVKPNIVVWRALLAACRTHKNDAIAAYAVERMNERDNKDNESGGHVLLSNTYAAVGKWDDVARVRLEMKEKGIRKAVGKSSIEIGGVNHEFSSGNDSHPEMGNIVLMLEEMNKRLEDAGCLPDLTNVIVDVDEDEKAFLLSRHSEKLAIAFGLVSTIEGAVLRVVKNLRICSDCHSFTKMVSKIYDREIVIRDNYRFHFFKDGSCSCNDYW